MVLPPGAFLYIFEFNLAKLIRFFSDINVTFNISPAPYHAVRDIDSLAELFFILFCTGASPVQAIAVTVNSPIKRASADGAV